MPAPHWTECPKLSAEGAFHLEWKGPKHASYRLEEHTKNGNAKVLYEGLDTATTVTGRFAGEYEYRVGILEDGSVREWSKTCSVPVEPPSLGLAFSLFGIGAVVSLGAVWAVLRGHRAHRQGKLQ